MNFPGFSTILGFHSTPTAIDADLKRLLAEIFSLLGEIAG